MVNDMMNWYNDLFDWLNDWIKMDDLVNGFGWIFLNVGSYGLVLKIDIKENDDQYMMKVDIFGIDKQNIVLKYWDGILLIVVKCDSISDESDKDGNIIVSEC